MKKIYCSLFGALLLLFFCCSCTDENDSLSGDTLNASDRLLVRYADKIANAKPYISSGMRELMNRLDTATVPVPIEEILPDVRGLFVSESTNSGVSTKAIENDVATGYDNYYELFRNKSITVSKTLSTLKESLDASEITGLSGTVYLSAFAVIKYMLFEDPVSTFHAATSSAEGDFIGVNPDRIDLDNISDDTSCSKGYSVEVWAEGEAYCLTTYVFVMSTSTDIYGGFILPYHSRYNNYAYHFDSYCKHLEWRYIATR